SVTEVRLKLLEIGVVVPSKYARLLSYSVLGSPSRSVFLTLAIVPLMRWCSKRMPPSRRSASLTFHSSATYSAVVLPLYLPSRLNENGGGTKPLRDTRMPLSSTTSTRRACGSTVISCAWPSTHWSCDE